LQLAHAIFKWLTEMGGAFIDRPSRAKRGRQAPSNALAVVVSA